MFRNISVILPAYNEEDNILECLSSTEAYLAPKFTSYEIIVVDDGSNDQTSTLVKKYQKGKKYIRLIKHAKNLGYGSALTSGFRSATKSLLFYTDSDNQFDIKDLDKLLPLITDYDIVCGYRVNRQDPLMRKAVAFVYNRLIRILFGLKIRDVDCSFKLYKRSVFEAIHMTSHTGLLDAEILVRALKMGFSITQVGVTHYPRTKGKTIYEIGNRGKYLAFVRPKVIIELLQEMKTLSRTLATT